VNPAISFLIFFDSFRGEDRRRQGGGGGKRGKGEKGEGRDHVLKLYSLRLRKEREGERKGGGGLLVSFFL